MNTLTPYDPQPEKLTQLVTDGLTSDHSKRAYRRALLDFFAWHQEQGRPPLTKALVQQYRQTLEGSPASVNLRMSAIRKLAQEAADNGLLDQTIANGVSRVKGATSHGVRTGNWADKKRLQQILASPDITTLKGLRDRAILSVMIGGGLRRSEVSALTFEHLQQRDGRWVIVDLIGKGNRVRTVPIPPWAKVAIDEWAEASSLLTGRMFRAIHKGGYLTHESMTPQAVRDVVKLYAPELAAHDLRRSFAKLAHKGGAPMEQIQLSLGHSSVKTTERYLGVTQDLTDAPCDHLGLSIK